MLWTISSGKIAAHLEYVIDGVEEAVGELMQGIQMTKRFKEQTEEKPDQKTLGTQTEGSTAPNGPGTPRGTPNSVRSCKLI